MIRRPPRSTLFPTRRSSDLYSVYIAHPDDDQPNQINSQGGEPDKHIVVLYPQAICLSKKALDRKSTRLNSSHSQISYAVFCLKKKKDATGVIVNWMLGS